MITTVDRFGGWIAGLGTASGLRLVIGRWLDSPLGGFTDVMLEWRGGHRLLLAPDERVAEFVAGTYRFDEVAVVHVSLTADGDEWHVTAGPLTVALRIGGRPPLGWLLRVVPATLATAPRWIACVDVIARRVLPGVRTRGSAGSGREELYAALDLRRIRDARVHWHGADQGALAPVAPPVRFGFGSTPRTPALVRAVTLVRGRR